MAISSTIILSFASLLLLSSSYSEADLIGDICSASYNPASCNKALRSDPRSAGADLRALGQIIIPKVKDAINNTNKVAMSLKVGVNPATIKKCVAVLSLAIDHLNACVSYLGKNPIDVVALQAYAYTVLNDDLQACNDSFRFAREIEPPVLTQANRIAQELSDVLVVITKRL